MLYISLSDQGSIPGKNFSPHHLLQTSCEFHPASYQMGTRALSPRVKQLGHEAIPPYVFMVWCLIMHRMCLRGMVLNSCYKSLK